MAISRRKMLYGSAAVLLTGGGALLWADRTLNPRTPLSYAYPPPEGNAAAPTRECADDPTESVTEGPFYLAKTPLRTTLREATTVGVPLTIIGRVVNTKCVPVEGAVLDFWSCDGNGVYDRDGYHLRGHQFTNAAGEYHLETVKPLDYRQFGVHRTAHIHVKVQGRETRLLTTQLYFPGEKHNERDLFFDDSLALDISRQSDGSLIGRFDFVL
jgi:protocatechuate 3,4-dioxygenase beta subunit